MGAVYKNELNLYFRTMHGYIFISLILLFAGSFCILFNFVYGETTLSRMVGYLSTLFILIIPLLTMRSFAEERKSRIDRLFNSLPLRTADIVLGKFFAIATLLAVPFLCICFYPLILSLYGPVSLKTAYSTLLGLFMLGCALSAIGLFISSFSESQLAAAGISFAVFFAANFMSSFSGSFSPSSAASYRGYAVLILLFGLVSFLYMKNGFFSLGLTAVLEAVLFLFYRLFFGAFAGSFIPVLNYLALFDRLASFENGIFDVTALIYYGSLTALMLFLTTRLLEKARWSR